MENKELKKKLQEAKAQIIAQSKDAHYTKQLISKILSYKGQLGIEPASVFVPADIESEIKQSAYHIFRTNSYVMVDKEGKDINMLGQIVFKVRGLAIVIDPILNAYYFPFNTLLDAHDHFEELDEDMKKNYQILLDHTIIMCQAITLVFSDTKLLEEVLNPIIKYLNNQMEKAEDVDNLPNDNPIANKEFKESTLATEELKNELENDNKENN